MQWATVNLMSPIRERIYCRSESTRRPSPQPMTCHVSARKLPRAGGDFFPAAPKFSVPVTFKFVSGDIEKEESWASGFEPRRRDRAGLMARRATSRK